MRSGLGPEEGAAWRVKTQGAGLTLSRAREENGGTLGCLVFPCVFFPFLARRFSPYDTCVCVALAVRKW